MTIMMQGTCVLARGAPAGYTLSKTLKVETLTIYCDGRIGQMQFNFNSQPAPWSLNW